MTPRTGTLLIVIAVAVGSAVVTDLDAYQRAVADWGRRGPQGASEPRPTFDRSLCAARVARAAIVATAGAFGVSLIPEG
jgi:hypothetical protein